MEILRTFGPIILWYYNTCMLRSEGAEDFNQAPVEWFKKWIPLSTNFIQWFQITYPLDSDYPVDNAIHLLSNLRGQFFGSSWNPLIRSPMGQEKLAVLPG